MRKKVLALMSALTIMVTGSMTAFAAGSPSVPTVETPAPGQVATTVVTEMKTATEYVSTTTVSNGFTVTQVTQTVIQTVAVTVQNQILNNLASIGSMLGNNSIVSAATNSSQRVTASVLSVVDVSAETATRAANGNYVVTMNIPSIVRGDAIAVLHYTGSTWETIVPSNVANGSVTFETASLSPISVIKLEVEGLKAAPRTGESVPVVAVVMFIGLAGAAFCGKKYFS